MTASAGHGLSAVKDERGFAWKLLLPVIPDRPVLSIGLDGSGLVSLGRSWRTVHTLDSPEGGLGWAREQAAVLELRSRFELACVDNFPAGGYHAIAVGGRGLGHLGPDEVLRLLADGGSVIWAGHSAQLPGASSLTAAGYGPARRYAVVPPDRCKVIIPVSDRVSALSGLDFHVPGRTRNRIAFTVGRLAARSGCGRYLSASHLLEARRPGALPEGSRLFEWLGDRLGVRVADAAIYPGSGSYGRRRATLLAMDDKARGVAVLKVADTPAGREVNNYEKEVLELLGRDIRLQTFVPRVIDSDDWRGHSVLAQEYMQPTGRRNVTGLTPAHTAFLEALSGLDRRDALLHDWPGWRRLLDWSGGNGFKTYDDADAVRQTIKRCAGILSGLKLTMHRIHGDFSPWNMFVAGGRLVVFDWEYSEPCGLPFYDLVHFVMRRMHYIDNNPASLGELLTATPQSMGVSEQVLALGYSIPVIKEARCKDRADVTNALFRLAALYAEAVKTSAIP